MLRASAVAASLLALIFLGGCAVRGAEFAGVGEKGDLDQGWRFAKGDVKGAQDVAFDDSKWGSVALPHTWNAKDGEDGGNNYYRGVGWYRRHLDLRGMEVGGKELYLRFSGASFKSEVYVNGKLAGTHNNMFGAFCFDVTGLMNAGGDNVIAVRCDNAKDPNVTPLSADFTFFGGIYRGVELLVKDKVCISPVDDAGPGVYVRQTDVSADSAKLEVTVKMRNAGVAATDALVQVDLVDPEGKKVTSGVATTHAEAGATGDAVVELTVDHPHLWNARKDPYLYSVRTVVMDGRSKVIAGLPALYDASTVSVGIRFFRVDPDKGFFLNGVSYPLHGVNRHQDRLDMGWAITDKEQKEDFDLIMEMGCTGIRLSHYQHAQDFYDLCDQGGLVVWAESCMVNRVTDSPEFKAAAEQQLRELIKQNYNHPSICFWSIFNELGNGTKDLKGDALKQQDAAQIEIVKDLNAEVHALDATRLSVAATNRGEPAYPLNVITDVIGFNRYDGWYSRTMADWPKELDALHKGLPARGVAISEYGAGASVMQHEYDPKQPKTTGKWHPEEWQSEVHEAAYGAMKERPWMWGTFLWCMFDFASDGRNEGDHAGINDKGLVTYDRKVKKDAFYFYKANWSEEKFAYITDRRFTPRPKPPTADGTYPVKVYSNCGSVELFVNGESVGKMSDVDAVNHAFVFKGVKWREGKNEIRAVGTDGGKTFEDGCEIVVDAGMKGESHPAVVPIGPPIENRK